MSKAQAVEACGAVRRGERRRAAELCCRRVVAGEAAEGGERERVKGRHKKEKKSKV